MSTLRIKPMGAAALAAIDDPCGGCGYTGPSNGARAVRTNHRPRPSRSGIPRRLAKQDPDGVKPGRSAQRPPAPPGRGGAGPVWAVEVADLWGLCGVSAQQDDATPGYLTLTAGELVPDLVLPGWAGRTAQQLHPDAAVFLDVAVCADYRDRHVGRDLVRAAAGQLVKRHVGIIEVIATSGAPVRLAPDAAGDMSMTLLPVGFWQAVGFRVVRPHPVAPTLRLDLAGTERRLPDFADAWQRFAELISRPAPPRPARFQEEPDGPRARDLVTQ